MINKQNILNEIDNLVSNFIYYDCKNNDEREHGDIKALLDKGKITIDEMVAKFRECLIVIYADSDCSNKSKVEKEVKILEAKIVILQETIENLRRRLDQ